MVYASKPTGRGLNCEQAYRISPHSLLPLEFGQEMEEQAALLVGTEVKRPTEARAEWGQGVLGGALNIRRYGKVKAEHAEAVRQENNRNSALPGSVCAPGSGLTLDMSPRLILTASPGGKDCCHHLFTDEKRDAERLSNLLSTGKMLLRETGEGRERGQGAAVPESEESAAPAMAGAAAWEPNPRPGYAPFTQISETPAQPPVGQHPQKNLGW